MSSTFVSYNGLAHPQGTVDCAVRFDSVLNEGEQIVAYKARADIKGTLISQAGSQADLTAQIQAIQTAYVNGGDLVLIGNDGSRLPSSILNAKTLGGTRVVSAPSFPELRGAQWVTYLTWTAAIEAELPTIVGGLALWSFEESISFQGTGGPAFDVIECVQGSPVPQTIAQRTAMSAVQDGKAVGYLGPPLLGGPGGAMLPLWPAIEQQQYRVIIPGSPRRTGSGFNTSYKQFPLAWRYTFKSPTPFGGEPHVWPV